MQNENVSIAEKNTISPHSQDADILKISVLSISAVESMLANSDIGRRLNVVDLPDSNGGGNEITGRADAAARWCHEMGYPLCPLWLFPVKRRLSGAEARGDRLKTDSTSCFLTMGKEIGSHELW